ncbi:hypothetical protein PY257_09270 [Ramlibacter sp. H39-3-26]|uniref:hypothetical protein n=1 Tax=Curvibacter soli TaxID=3031331 RepID=UPI0023DA9C20|nr:hypothetical protein [Ramlibacter sp. H39-3-26]MDF1485366.1 hypothetical protein [Ramlibacter sp. H39-3-26]
MVTPPRTEGGDKRLWHKRWRLRERDQFASLGPGDDPLPVHRQDVSSTWDMAKDGKHWFDLRRQQALAERIAARRSQSNPERKSLQARLLAQWRAK